MNRKRLDNAFVVIVTALAIVACDSDANDLSGSVSEFYPLGFETVRARLYGSELAIEYVRVDGETVARVTVRRAELDPTGPGVIDLADFGDLTGSAGGVELPPFYDGTLELTAYRPVDRAPLSGSFEARIQSGATRLSIRGTFKARLELVEVP